MRDATDDAVEDDVSLEDDVALLDDVTLLTVDEAELELKAEAALPWWLVACVEVELLLADEADDVADVALPWWLVTWPRALCFVPVV